jgi:hypothetical protein
VRNRDERHVVAGGRDGAGSGPAAAAEATGQLDALAGVSRARRKEAERAGRTITRTLVAYERRALADPAAPRTRV